jgi:predicted transposase/invertase (TIGR01784 family)
VCEKLPPKEHDTTFKFLFADKEEILLLVKDILHYTWADNIEEDTIELVKTNYVTQHFSQVEADVVAKAKLKDKEVYFYILIENQSKVKREMQQKILKYMISLWAEEIRKGVQILPAIIPIVVYNGIGERWNVSTDLMEAFDVFKDDVFRYRVVDIIELDVKKLLEREEDVLTPIVFYLEQAREDRSELIGRLLEVEKNLKKLSKKNVDRFLEWSYHIIRPRLAEDQKSEFDRIAKRVKQEGVEAMGEFISNVARLLDEAKTKDFLAGKLEGKLEGKIEGKIEGKLEGKLEATIEFAKRLIQKGFSDEEVAELTELQIEKVKELRKSMVN